ncbi:MAG: 4Fe-4S binding protein [Alphaproteobacteria bacterium]|nr:4Fe-4S binding protein [Alphaproteobacteria bacterium]
MKNNFFDAFKSILSELKIAIKYAFMNKTYNDNNSHNIKDARFNVMLYKTLCNNCRKCVKVCPANAIIYNEKNTSNACNVQLVRNKCIQCALCADVCDKNAIKYIKENEK